MSYTLYRPETVDAAIALQCETGGSYLAGGTVMLVDRHRGKLSCDSLISLDRIAALKQIVPGADCIRIGAGVTMDELEHSPAVRSMTPALWQAACEVGGPQVRNRATLGGNLAAASPAADCAVPLLAMDAVLLVQGAQGARRIPLREFFLGPMRCVLSPDELIVTIHIPVQPGARAAFRKIGKRSALAVSCLSMCVSRAGEAVCVAAGAAAPKPLYCSETSRLLAEGQNAAAFDALQREIRPIDDRWATASYRRTVSARLLAALLEETEEMPCTF